MLKMIIVDDEKIIRETIHSIIDWQSLGIEVVGVCKDGIDAFDKIVDEYPDIVMTDIRMPGLSGLDLIQKVNDAELAVEFVILSGYNEFEFAKTAMKYGVKHYLLKPCNEDEIIEVMKECTQACQKKQAERLDNLLTDLFHSEDADDKTAQKKFYTLLSAQTELKLLKTVLIKLLMLSSSEKAVLSDAQMTENLLQINQCRDCEACLQCAEKIMTTIFDAEPKHKYTNCVEKIQEYVCDHLSDSNLSLKWIAENYLYMNVDYISKQFVKQTGSKFSAYLTEQRITKAKHLLLDPNIASPYEVAEKVGFGNNPQYFSQIFKKYTTMTPSAYIKSVK